MSVRPAKTQISLGIRPVWSESSLCAQWLAKDPSFLHADSEDSDQTGWMPRLIWVFAGRTLILLVLTCHGSFYLPNIPAELTYQKVFKHLYTTCFHHTHNCFVSLEPSINISMFHSEWRAIVYTDWVTNLYHLQEQKLGWPCVHLGSTELPYSAYHLVVHNLYIPMQIIRNQLLVPHMNNTVNQTF